MLMPLEELRLCCVFVGSHVRCAVSESDGACNESDWRTRRETSRFPARTRPTAARVTETANGKRAGERARVHTQRNSSQCLAVCTAKMLN